MMTASTRRLFLSTLVLAVGYLVHMPTFALASAPEVPEVTVSEVNASEASLRGVLNPNNAAGEAGTYQFVLRATATKQCEGVGEVLVPLTPALSSGFEHEETSPERLQGLTAATEYAVCIVASEPGKTEPAVSAAVTFKTATPPEAPEAQPATGITGSGATLRGVLNPGSAGEPGSYQFLYRPSATECEGGGALQQETAPTSTDGEQLQAVAASVTGLLPTTQYTYCLRSENSAGEAIVGAPATFETTTAPPSIEHEAIADVGSTEVTLLASIAPGGAPTTYEVEYEPGILTPPRTLPASAVPISVSERVKGLQPSKEYQARFRAHNDLGPAEGTGVSFTMAASGATGTPAGITCRNAGLSGFSVALPDCRAYELVSQAAERGEVYDPGGSTGRIEDTTTPRPFRAAADGSGVTFVADPGPVGGDGSSAIGHGNEYLARRGASAGQTGWETTNITPPVSEQEESGNEREYEAFSSDLSVGLVAAEQPLVAAAPSPQAPASCSALYSRDIAASGAGGYHSLFTETQFPRFCGELGHSSRGRANNLAFAGESADHSQKLFQSPAPLTSDAAEPGGVGSNLYDSTNGALSLVNVLPNGTVEPNATFGGPSEMPNNPSNFSHIMSSDGRRVFWSSVQQGEGLEERPVSRPTALYARETPSPSPSITVQLDKAQSSASGESGGGLFWVASVNGSKAFFTDCQRLTEDATADPSEGCGHLTFFSRNELRTGNDLYEYDFARPEGQRLVDLTVDHNGSDPRGADVQGVIGASDDGTIVYFVAGGALDSEPNFHGEVPTDRTCEQSAPEKGQEEQRPLPAGKGCNLYELRLGASRTTQFVTVLAARDNYFSSNSLNDPFEELGQIAGDWAADLGSRTAEVSPDGLHLVLMSTQPLTGYDNSALGSFQSGEGASEVFVYSASTKTLACASCAPDGASPDASIHGQINGPATYLPISSSSTFMRRWMNAQGTAVFFDSSQPLVSGDGNHTQDVYEWRAEDTESCPVATSKYGGCVFLLSGGESADFSYFVDADETGENVFFTHRGPLGNVGPHDDINHLYDARAFGGFSATSFGCTGSTCRAVPSVASSPATPPSVTFSGSGNFPPQPQSPITAKKTTSARLRAEALRKALKVCKRKHSKSKKRRLTCERSAHKRYRASATKAKKTAHS